MEFADAFSIHLLENIHKSYDRSNFFALIDDRFGNEIVTIFGRKLNKKNRKTTNFKFLPRTSFLSDLLDFDAILKENLNKEKKSATNVRDEQIEEKEKSVENVNACSLSTIQSVEMEISIDCHSDQNDQIVDSDSVDFDINRDHHQYRIDATDFNDQNGKYSANRDFDRGDQLPEISYNEFDKKDDQVMPNSLDHDRKSCQIVHLEIEKLAIENIENEDQNQSINNELHQTNNSNIFEKSNDGQVKRLSLGSPTPPLSGANSPRRTSPYNLRRKSLSLDRKTTIKSPKENRSSVLRRKASSEKI